MVEARGNRLYIKAVSVCNSSYLGSAGRTEFLYAAVFVGCSLKRCVTLPLIGPRIGDADDLQESAPQSKSAP